MTNLLLIMTVIYLSCLFNHAVLWIEQSLWERRRLQRVKLVCWHKSWLRSTESRLVAFAPYGLNKLRFTGVSQKEEFLETSHSPSSASTLSPVPSVPPGWAVLSDPRWLQHAKAFAFPGVTGAASGTRQRAAKMGSCPQFKGFPGLGLPRPLTSFPPFTDSLVS